MNCLFGDLPTGAAGCDHSRINATDYLCSHHQRHVAFSGTAALNVASDIWQGSPSGSSGTASVTYAVAPSIFGNVSSYLVLYRLVSPVTTAFATNNTSVIDNSSISTTINVASGGVGLAYVVADNATPTFGNWTNATQDSAETADNLNSTVPTLELVRAHL
jgi:hypothetical protein